MKLKFLLLITCIQTTLFGQTFTDYKWEGEMPKRPEIPQDFMKEDAVIIKSQTVSKSLFTGSFPEIDQLATYQTYEHILLNKEEALSDYKRLVVPKFNGRIGDFVQMKFVDLRIRKQNGNVIDLKIKDLPLANLTETDELYSQKEENYIYEIQGLEVGDEIERITVIESKFPDQGRIVNLYQEYPVLDASFVIEVSTMVKVNGRVYNGMPIPQITEKGEQRVYSWKMQNLQAIPEANAEGAIFTKNLAYFVYELNLDAFRMEPTTVKVLNFSDLIMQYVSDFMEPRVRNKKKYKEFYDELFLRGAKEFGKTDPLTLTKLEKTYLLNHFIQKEMKSAGKLEDFEKSEGIEYFLVNKKIDYANLMCIYRDFFEKNEIEYYLAIGKSRFNGDFDLDYVSSTQIASYLFVFKDEAGNTFTIVPGSGLNEMPSSLLGTKLYMKNIVDPKAKLQSIEFGQDDLKNEKNNKRSRRTEINILADGKAEIKTNLSLTGLFSDEGRDFLLGSYKEDSIKVRMERAYKNRFKDKEVFFKEAQLKKMETTAPYDFQFETQMGINAFLTEDSKWEMKVSDWLAHSIRWISNAKKRTLDHHNSFAGTDIEEIIITFPYPVQIDNIAELNKSKDTDKAAYKLSVALIKDNVLRIQSRYQVKQILIPAQESLLQQDVNELWKTCNEFKFLIKKKL